MRSYGRVMSSSAVLLDAGPTIEIDHPARVRRLVSEVGQRALAVTDLTALRWLTGFESSHGWAVIRDGSLWVGTAGRYGAKAAAETAGTGAELIVEQDRATLRSRMVELLGGVPVLVDSASMTHGAWSSLLDAGLDLVDTPSMVMAHRTIKDAAEIERMELAAGYADAALAEVEPMIAPGVSELDLRAELEYRMVRLGADARSYATIVSSGPVHGARPHHGASRRRLEAGDTLIIDVGGLVAGYHSDMTRSWVVGEASAEQRATYQLVVESHAAGLAMARPGESVRAVDAACRDVFAAAGRLDEFLHGTGHAVGLEVHEQPFVNQAGDGELAAGMVVTVEPGLYRGDFGGFRIEDLVLITESGHRVLTHSPKREL